MRNRRVILTALLTAWLGGTLSAASRAQERTTATALNGSGVFVEQQTDCMDSSEIHAALSTVLSKRPESEYMSVTVVISKAVADTLAVLRVVDRTTGEILLERRLHVTAAECAEAHLVLTVMLEQFLADFPIEEWMRQRSNPAPKPAVQIEKVTVEKEIAPLRRMLLIGIDSRWPTPNGSLELSLGVDAGGRRRGILGHLILRAVWPRPLGEGRCLDTAALLAVGMRFSPTPRSLLRMEIRTGALLVNGIGYEKNYHHWLVTVEAQMSVLFQVGAVFLGPEIAVSPVVHAVHAETGESEDLPWIRAGILTGIFFGETVLK